MTARRWLMGAGAAALLLVGGIIGGPIAGLAGGESATQVEEHEEVVAAGTIDDGRDLLPRASITLEQAITAAQGAVEGALGEVDLEYVGGRLVFNVDIGKHDVKVDAQDGSIVSVDADD